MASGTEWYRGSAITTATAVARRAAVSVILAGAAFAAGRGPAAGQATETIRLGGPRVGVYNLAGGLTVLPGDGPDAVVEVTRRGRDAARLEIVRGTVDGRPTLSVRYPGDEVVYPDARRGSSTTLRVADDGTFGENRDGRRVTVRGSGSGLEAWVELRVHLPVGGALDARVAVGDVSASGVEGDLRLDTGSGSVEVETHRGVLVVDTGSGAVSLADIDGELSVDTGSGEIRARQVRGSRVALDTGSGPVSVEGLVAPAVRVDTGSGPVDLRGVASADVVVDTGSGGVRLELLEDVDRLDVDTGSGPITVRLPEDVGAEVEAETGSGPLRVEFELEGIRRDRNHLEGRIGDGRGLIRLDSGSGGVSIQRG